MMSSQRRSTRQRRAVIEAIHALANHPTAEDIFFEVRKRLPTVSLATVYRNLNILVDQGNVAELPTGASRRYDGTTDRHSHVVCTICGAICDVWLPDGQAEAIVSFAEATSGYRTMWHRTELFGVCPGCRESERQASPAHT